MECAGFLRLRIGGLLHSLPTASLQVDLPANARRS
ncbi:hypothetical protein H4W80_002857 [Nonomuraea angiospora]|uniref:Uncharacterized protein n=1 Tax=Nonomuraea angiospora TaxID=46172 RepID=A0ABR9LVC9_9ACTN|nr:hypothetical protein [Nonomuraea angiospora]